MLIRIYFNTTETEFYFKEIYFHTTGDYMKGYVEATFYSPNDGEVDIMYRVSDPENGRDNAITWTSRPTKMFDWLNMVLGAISLKCDLKSVIGFESSEFQFSIDIDAPRCTLEINKDGKYDLGEWKIMDAYNDYIHKEGKLC